MYIYTHTFILYVFIHIFVSSKNCPIAWIVLSLQHLTFHPAKQMAFLSPLFVLSDLTREVNRGGRSSITEIKFITNSSLKLNLKVSVNSLRNAERLQSQESETLPFKLTKRVLKNGLKTKEAVVRAPRTSLSSQ